MTRPGTAGTTLALATAGISGVAVFLNSYGVKTFESSGSYTTAKNTVAALVLLTVVGVLSASSSGASGRILRRPAGPRQWWTLALVGVIGGSVPFLLFFEGLSRASSSDAAFVHKTLVVWVALLAVPLLGERVGALQWGAIALLVLGQASLAGGWTTPLRMPWGSG